MRKTQIKEAVRLARSGQREPAKEIFLEIVAQDERNELAWLWLSGLVDDLEDKIIALENALAINPQNEKARQRLESLTAQRQPAAVAVGAVEAAPPSPPPAARPRRPRQRPTPSMRKAMQAFKEGNYADARSSAQYALRYERPDVNMWLICARTADDIDEEIEALQHVLELDPGREKSRARIARLKEIKQDPFLMAEYHLKHQRVEDARRIYRRVAQKSPSASQKAEAKQRLRGIDLPGRAHPYKPSSPRVSFWRLLFGPLVLYGLMVWMQTPAAGGMLFLGALSIVLLAGSGLNILMQDTLNHPLMYKLFGKEGLTSEGLRYGLQALGIGFMLIPFALVFAF